jgi:hypothetical protein
MADSVRVQFTASLVSAPAFVVLLCLAIGGSRAEPADDWVQDYRVQLLMGDKRAPGFAGVYLGNGLVITASHVAGADTRGVRIDGVDVPARLVKTGGFFPKLDLSLISMEQWKIPDKLRARKMPLCQQQPPVGAPVILASLQEMMRTSIASPDLISPEYRTKFPTLISEGKTDGKSGSGVFDLEGKCLLGIQSLKITKQVDHKDYVSYFVPAHAIRSFMPAGLRP